MARKSRLGTFAIFSLLPITSAISLASFQQIPKTVQVPLSCSLAYSSSIPFCTSSDFQNGAACSSSCIQSLKNVALNVNTACAGAVVDGSTLLGKVFQGQLVQVLCPNTIQATTPAKSTTSTVKATQTAVTLTPPSTSNAATSPSLKISGTKVSSTATSFSTDLPSSSSETRSSSSTAPASSIQSVGNGIGDASPTSIAIPSAPSATSSTASAAKTSAVAQSPKHPSMLEQQIAALKDSGGGSPFDFISAGSTTLLPGRLILVGCALGLLLTLVR